MIYDDYATALVKDVPQEYIKALVNTFMTDAGINMGADFTDTSLERVIEIVRFNFKFLPVCYIASAFKKGSLGNYGTGRLVPRTINNWLNEITLEHNRDESHKKLTRIDEVIHFKDLRKYPLGKAICKKIDWLESGAITIDEWDKIPLKVLAEIIGAGHIPDLEYFIIKLKT
jgi:hypothetical protein